MRTRTSSVVMTMGLSLAIATSASSAQADGLGPDDQLTWEAAQALYGGGLTVNKVKGGVAIAAAPNGLTQDKYNAYVELYLDVYKTMSLRQRGTSFKWLADYSDAKFAPRSATKLAALLLEPAFKFQLCKDLSSRIGPKPKAVDQWDRTAWCVQQGIIDATTNTCVYRGETATCSAVEDRGALAPDEAIFVKRKDGSYPIIVTVSGGRDHITNATVNIASWMQDALVSVSKLTPRIKADWTARKTKYFKAERATIAKQRKLAGNKVAFANTPFVRWEAQAPAKTVSCKTPHVVLFAPEKALANDYYYVYAVDGTVCDEHPVGAGESVRDNIHGSEQCRNLLDAGDKHAVSVTLHEMKIGATSTKRELKDGRVKDVKYEWGKAGKKLFGGSVACTR